MAAQDASKRPIDVTVADSYGRKLTGLGMERFSVAEAGVQRTITTFSEVRDEAPQSGVHYHIEFESSATNGAIQVVLNPPPGLPHLTLT